MSGKGKHITLSDRIEIEWGLKEGKSFRAIASIINKSPSSVSYEVKNRYKIKRTGAYGRSFNDCRNSRKCKKMHLCSDYNCNKLCKGCYKCSLICPNYKKVLCREYSKAPFVCNGCKKKHKCTLEKHIYEADYANMHYKEILSYSRKGIGIDEQELSKVDNIVSPLVKQGQSLHHIHTTHNDVIMLSERSLYRYYEYNVFSTCNLDLRRKVKMRPRRRKSVEYKVDKQCRHGRKYDDYLKYIGENPDISTVQIDSVIGRRGGKTLLTIHFTVSSLMVGVLRPSNNAASVEEAFNIIYNALGHEHFVELFPLILTDNGSEFSNPIAIEYNKQHERRTSIFYCNPSSPYEKGAIENNHVLLRYIVPKGTSFDEYTQEDINLIFRHINSYSRRRLGNLCPIDVFKQQYGDKFLDIFGCWKIKPEEIILKPELLKK